MNITLLGTGFIGRFYAESLHAQRRKDTITMVYARSAESAARFAADFNIPHTSTNMEEAITHASTDVVVVALPNNLHLPAVLACAKAGKHVLCTKPLARSGAEAKQMMDTVEKAGIVGGYMEDLCYTPKFFKIAQLHPGRQHRPGTMGQKPRNTSWSAQRLVLGQAASRRRAP